MLVLTAAAGCQPSARQMQRELTQMTQQMNHEQMTLVNELNRQIAGYGCVSVRCEPAGARVWVDGGEVLDASVDRLVVPLGVHTFMARWPDGSATSRKVYVPQMNVDYEINYKAQMAQGSGSGGSNLNADVHKTAIVLTKPAK